MARINVEDSIYTDARFMKLLLRVGDLDTAIGSLIRAWSLGQKWYLSPNKMIPYSEWKDQCIRDEIIDVGLAERIGDGVKISGADKQFAWLAQRVESGKKGGLSRRGVKLPVEESARRQAARIVLSKEIKMGRVMRPEFCSDCGTKEKVQGHHSDYSKPLDVIWLCDSCHDKTHCLIEEANAKRTQANAKPPSSSSSSSSSSESSSSSKNNIAQQVERVYQESYPRKLGKTKGMKRLAREVKTDVDLEAFRRSVINYGNHCAGKDREYIKHFSTFASEWRDWVEVKEPAPGEWSEAEKRKIFGEDYVPESA